MNITSPARSITARLSAAGAAAALLVLGATACAAAPSAAPPAGESSAAQTPRAGGDDLQQWQLDFAGCMRSEGIDMPDPAADGSISLSIPDDMTAFDAATQTCEQQLGPAPGQNLQSDDAVQEEQLETAKCLRSHGYDIDDPAAGGAMGIPNDVTDADLAACGLTPVTM